MFYFEDLTLRYPVLSIQTPSGAPLDSQFFPKLPVCHLQQVTLEFPCLT